MQSGSNQRLKDESELEVSICLGANAAVKNVKSQLES